MNERYSTIKGIIDNMKASDLGVGFDFNQFIHEFVEIACPEIHQRMVDQSIAYLDPDKD